MITNLCVDLRLKFWSKVGNTLAVYQNMNHLYLTPDAGSDILHSSWVVSAESQNPISGFVKNSKYDYIQCPYDGWSGWEVDTGSGNFVPDDSLATECHAGHEGGYTTDTTATATTNMPSDYNGKMVLVLNPCLRK